MKWSNEPVSVAFAVVDDGSGIAALPGFKLRDSAAGSELLKLTREVDDERRRILNDPAVPREGRFAVAAEAARRGAQRIEEWRSRTIAKLDEQRSAAIPAPARQLPRESVLAVMLADLARLDPLALESVYTAPTTPPEVAGACEALPPRLMGGPIPVVAPRLSIEARAKRAWIEASDEQRARAEGLEAVRAHLGAAGAAALRALADEGE